MPRTLDDGAKAALGRNLRDARKARGWNQLQAAERVGVSPVRLNLWENGKEAPGTEGLLRVAIAYDCPVDELLGGVDEDYDAIIERRIPVDTKQFYKAKLDKLKALTLRAMQLTVEAGGTPAPTPETPAASRAPSRGKSPSTRARRTPKNPPKR
jgi:transcriptional regulator with XRE-family HTH domain